MFKVRIDPESRDFQKGSIWSLAGLALEFLGVVADIPNQGIGFSSPVALAATVTGTVFLIIGVFYLARSKNRSPAWALLGLASLFGWTLMAFMKDGAEKELEAPRRIDEANGSEVPPEGGSAIYGRT